jgi:hypothetical protein
MEFIKSKGREIQNRVLWGSGGLQRQREGAFLL